MGVGVFTDVTFAPQGRLVDYLPNLFCRKTLQEGGLRTPKEV